MTPLRPFVLTSWGRQHLSALAYLASKFGQSPSQRIGLRDNTVAMALDAAAALALLKLEAPSKDADDEEADEESDRPTRTFHRRISAADLASGMPLVQVQPMR